MKYADTAGSGQFSCSEGGSAACQLTEGYYPMFAKELVYDSQGRKIIEKDIQSDTETYFTIGTFGLIKSGCPFIPVCFWITFIEMV